jgi:hypothetical protein
MTDREQIEAEIHSLLQTETRATLLSNKLFSPPDGLFCRLGPTEAERRAIGRGELFRLAQKRVRELQYRDADRLAEIVAQRQNQAVDTRPEPADAAK